MSENSEEKQRLLIVDDSRVIRVTARKILHDHFETVEAVDGENAWELLSGEETFALVVSDLTMPRLDGFGLLERIRASHSPQIRELPVIIITGANDTDGTMERARNVGATDFIGKPFDAVHLLARTQAHANSHAASNALMQENTELEDKLSVDVTTGLYNENSFMERGYQQLSYAIRHDSNLAMFRIEIDGFGELFQYHGEVLIGAVLKGMGKTLTSVIREEDTAARTGTARFSLLLPGMNQAGIRNLAERINSTFVARSFMSDEERVSVTLSIGVGAPDIRRDIRFEEITEIADMHLIQAVSQGGNQIVYAQACSPPAIRTTEAALPEPALPEPVMVEIGVEEIPFSVTAMPEDVEEIDLSHVAIPGAVQEYGSDAAAAVECLAPGTPEPPGDSFAGPVPDNQRGLNTSLESSHAGTVAAGHPDSPAGAPVDDTPAEPDNSRSSATLPEIETDAITISAPFSAYTDQWTTQSMPGTADAAHGAFAKPEEPDTTPQRKGFFRKTLGLFGLFRSRR